MFPIPVSVLGCSEKGEKTVASPEPSLNTGEGNQNLWIGTSPNLLLTTAEGD